MNSTVVVRANAQAEPSLIVFGRDDAGKPRASWFDAGSAGLAAKAADLMKMRVLRVETEEQKAVARQLAPGRVFASGRAFTPFARARVFSQLVELAGDSSNPSTNGSTSGKPGAVASNGSAASGDQGPGPAPTAPADPKGGPSRPQSWDEIGIGSVVLAHESVDEGWWGVSGARRQRRSAHPEMARLPTGKGVRAPPDRTRAAACSRAVKLPHLGWPPAQVPRSRGDHHHERHR